MKVFGCLLRVPFKFGKPFRGIGRRFFFIVHVRDKVVPNVIDRFHVITALLHERVAVGPAKAHQANTPFDAQTRRFEPLGGFRHAGSGAHGIVDHDHRLARIDLALDQFAGTVLLSLFANEQTVIAAVLKQARLKNGNTGQAVRRDLLAVESFEELQHTLPCQFRSSWRERDGKRVEHPTRGGAVPREHRLRLRAIKDSAPAQQIKQLGAF